MSEPKPAALDTQEPETSTPAVVSPAPTAFRKSLFRNLIGYNDDCDTDSDNSEGCIIYERYERTLYHLVKQVHAAFAASPRPSPTATHDQKTGFITYWRSTFNKICTEIEADDSFPHYITDPPVSHCDIFLYTQNQRGPREWDSWDLRDFNSWLSFLPEDAPANIILQLEEPEDETGLTKGHLLRAVGGYLYGFDSLLPPLDAKLNITFDGGECQGEGEDIVWPTVYSEYELLGRREYPAYLINKGDRSRTLEKQSSDWDRPPSGNGEKTVKMKHVIHDDEDESDDDDAAAAEYKYPAVIWDMAWLQEHNDSVWGYEDYEVVCGDTPTLYLFCCPPGILRIELVGNGT
ncbi:hypothetical protein QBC37DRAFT_125865 [Rhypophila decipiens]|uniref:Uncharacterized protein n=1 Tax=Rhypophila decipiens TaxID=261697 RepID=A0AAN6YBC8_9PEZI|nr:hypothetical protein QBC37DRAFT_125865 [Rhypophila decipiens]